MARATEIENRFQSSHMKLLDLPLASTARVVALALDAAAACRLRAVGVFEGEAIMVLRRAPFGGPVHVRTSSGGEFALDRRIALAIEVAANEETAEAAE
jgi:ferrous iron transport protein A